MSDANEDPVGTDIAAAAPAAFAEKANNGVGAMLVLAVLAGLCIGFGSIGFLVVQGVSRGVEGPVALLSGLAFSVGLMLVTVTGAELFTGNTMFPLARMGGRLTWATILQAWSIVWIGNLIGSILLSVLFVAAGGHLGADGLVGEAAIRVTQDKLDKGAGTLLASGVLANILVCLAVWGSMAARTLPARLLAIAGPVTLFVAAGFEHSIANMSLLPTGWLTAQATGSEGFALDAIAANLVFSTIGNIVGGAGVALAMGWAHRTRPKD